MHSALIFGAVSCLWLVATVQTKSMIEVQHADEVANLRRKRSIVCYGDLGCFDNGPPFWSNYRPISFLPESPADIGTTFTIFTRQDTSGTVVPATDFSKVASSKFVAGRKTQFIVHGWQDKIMKTTYIEMKNALLALGDYNVILVDWSEGAKALYGQASANTRLVGAQIAQLIKQLKDTTGARPEDMHIIGFSLGAHTAGYAGETTPGLGRITALDPAEPYFQNTETAVRLDPTDATFVDVIHTDGASFFSTDMGLGMSQPCGHVDFYPNGGHDQPGCSSGVISFLQGLVNGEVIDTMACNHGRSVELFTDTIRDSSCPYRAYRCNDEADFENGKCLPCAGADCGIMGFRSDQVIPSGTNVKYFLKTGDKAPYCRYHYEVTLTFFASQGREERGRLFVQLFGSTGTTQLVELTEESTYIKPGSSYTYIMTSPKEVGAIGKVSFRFEHDWAWLDWGTWSWWRTPAVYLDQIHLYSGEAQQEKTVKVNGAKINDETTKTFSA